jgi:prevent-host-death family protein
MKTMTVSHARANLPDLIDQVNGKHKKAIEIVRHGEPVAAIMSAKLYESIVETLEILSDEETSRLLKKVLREAKRAKFIPAERVWKDLGIEL